MRTVKEIAEEILVYLKSNEWTCINATEEIENNFNGIKKYLEDNGYTMELNSGVYADEPTMIHAYRMKSPVTVFLCRTVLVLYILFVILIFIRYLITNQTIIQ